MSNLAFSKIWIIVVLITTLIVIIVGGIFWWQLNKVELLTFSPILPSSGFGTIYASQEEFVIKETPEGKIVENKIAGLEVKVPQGWEAEKVNIGWDYLLGKPTDECIVDLTSQDAEFDEKTHLLKKGCGISIIVGYSEKNVKYKELSRYIRFVKLLSIFEPQTFKELQEKEKIEVVKVANRSALKVVISENQAGKGIAIEIPLKNKILYFDTLFVPGHEERCSQEFNKFLEEVLIK